MPIYTVRHTTVYRYAQPVGFGEHRIIARPRESSDQKLIGFDLAVTPGAASRRWTRDVFGNAVCTMRFATRADTLSFVSTATVEQAASHPNHFDVDASARTLPVAYGAAEKPDLAPLLERTYADPDGVVDAWARAFLRDGRATPTLDLLAAMTAAIRRRFTYVRRVEKGVQSPAETLALGSGTCRDFTVLMMEAVRSLGLPARFVSGYMHVLGRENLDRRGGGSTHAWLQVYLPGAGWIDFDPTNATIGNEGLIRVAVVRDPAQAVPLTGSYTGFPSDDLGMTVTVAVLREDDARERISAGQVAGPGS